MCVCTFPFLLFAVCSSWPYETLAGLRSFKAGGDRARGEMVLVLKYFMLRERERERSYMCAGVIGLTAKKSS